MAWITVPDLGKGLNLDATPEELSLGSATSGTNMRFRTGYAERRKGVQTVFTTPVITPYHICHFTVGTARYVVYAGTAKTYVDDGATQTNITNADNTGGINDRWSGFVFNGVYVQNNGVDVPQYWGGNTASDLANLTAWPAGHKAGVMRPFGNYLVAGDITRAGVRERSTILWSSLADPGALPASWDITDATKEAGDVSLSETNGTIIDMCPLGGMNVIYKDDAIFAQQPLQSSLIFRFSRLPGETGLLARGCVVNTPAGHVLLTPGLDVVLYDGQQMRSLITGRMRTWLFNNINQSQAVRSFLAVSPNTTEVLVCFPAGSATSCTKALIWNWKDDTFSVQDLSNVTYGSTGQVSITSTTSYATTTDTYATATTSYADYGTIDGIARLIFTGTAPRLSMYDRTEQDNGSSFTATLETSGVHFDKPEVRKLCRGLRPKIDATAGTVISVQLGAADVPDGSVTWSDAVSFTVGTDIEVNSFASGRFLAFRLYTTADTAWRLRSMQADVVEQGAY